MLQFSFSQLDTVSSMSSPFKTPQLSITSSNHSVTKARAGINHPGVLLAGISIMQSVSLAFTNRYYIHI